MNLLKRDDQSTMGFRPEHFLPLEAFHGATGLHRVTFQILRVENLGADHLLYGELQTPMRMAKVIARIPSTIDIPFTSGAAREFAIKERDLHYFDATTGLRLQA